MAASLENVVNIWPLSSEDEDGNDCRKNWFNETFTSFVTAITWPKIDEKDSCEYLLIGQMNGTVTLVIISTGYESTEELITPSYTCAVSHLAWFNGDKEFAVGYTDGTIKLGKRNPNFNTILLIQYNSSISGLEWDPHGELLVTAATDGNCHIWHEFDGNWKILYNLKQSHEITSLIWSPFIGKSTHPLLLVFGTAIGSIIVWCIPHENNSNFVPKLMFNVQG